MYHGLKIMLPAAFRALIYPLFYRGKYFYSYICIYLHLYKPSVMNRHKPFHTYIFICICYCLVLWMSFPSRSLANIRFISTKDGLSNSSVHSFFQDRHNYIWIATDFGLNRLSGTEITVFNQSFQDSLSLPNNYITTVYEDSRHNFWVGSLNGLFRYDGTNESFTYALLDEYPFLYKEKISCITEDSNGSVWIVVSGKGIIRVSPDNKETVLFDSPGIRDMDITCMLFTDTNRIWLASKYTGIAILDAETGRVETLADNHLLDENPIFSLCEDSRGNILAASLGKGIYRIPKDTKKVSTIGLVMNMTVGKMAHSILRDRKNRIWVGTDGGGLWLFDEKSEMLIPYYLQNLGFNTSIGKVQCLYEDNQGNIWVSYVEKGVVVIPAQDGGFKIIENNPYNQLNITDQSIVSVLADHTGKLWIGTSGSGLYRLKTTDNTDGYIMDGQLLSPDLVITTLFQDAAGLIYIGTYLDGFYIYDPRLKTIQHFNKDIPGSLNCNHVTGFAEDQEGIIWISTNGGGINRMDPVSKEFLYFRQAGGGMENYLLSDWCNCLFIDDDQMLWVGTYAGASCMDLRTYKIKTYTQADNLNNNAIIAISGDHSGNIWIGSNWGLNKINKQNNTIKLYTSENGLLDNAIVGFQSDASGNLWISTNSGIAKYDESCDSFTGYTIHDGIYNQEFKPRAATVDRQGNLYFGGTNGVTWFHPGKLLVNEPILGLVLSRFSLFNEPVNIGQSYDGNMILKKSLQTTGEITLNYNQNHFSINFDALAYISPKRVKYQYMLKGLDPDWQNPQPGSQAAVYTNVPPGNYTFLVKAFVADTNQKITQLNILILPPWWLTWWARAIYILTVLLILYGLYKMLIFREKEKQRMLEKEHNEELAQLKLQFFTNISHEIRTPLTLVISPLIKLMQEESSAKHMSVYQTMHRNATRILRLINQLLDIRKIDRNQMNLHVRETDVISFINDITDSFSPLCKDKDIELTFSSEKIPDTVWIDVDFMDKILYNLLSNAFKFTHRGGHIDIRLVISPVDELVVEIQDTGIGISSDYLQKIFERFYQANGHKASMSTGTGIGLHLTKMLIELHHGRIEVSSTEGKGSVFTVYIPCKRDDYSINEVLSTPIEYNDLSVHTIPLLLEDIQEGIGSEEVKRLKNKPLILIVEDNKDIRSLLKNELQAGFSILEALDGKKGYEAATQHIPDLIITDVMMPVQNGIEMTRRLRENNNTRHIPIIMLTARTTMDDNIEGLESGADVYITKPFDLRYLMIHIVNLINRHILLRSKHATVNVVETSDFKIKSADDKLMEKLNNLIKERLSDSSLSIELVSRELGLSRAHLHRKLKELCQLTPSIYIRNIRLEHAAHLLKYQKISIAEVAYAVGFSSHQYFSNCFKDFYGISPAEYAEKNRDNQ